MILTCNAAHYIAAIIIIAHNIQWRHVEWPGHCTQDSSTYLIPLEKIDAISHLEKTGEKNWWALLTYKIVCNIA